MKANTLQNSVLFLASLGALTSCNRTTLTTGADATGDRAAVEAAVRSSAESFKAAIIDRDIDKMLAYYTADAWQMPQNGSIARTDAERRKYWMGVIALPIERDIVDVADRVDIASSGDLAMQYGEFRQVMMDKDGSFSSITQKFINGWRKQSDGSWKVSVSMASVGN